VPELPEVETVVRLIRPRLTGRKMIGARFSVPRQLRPQTPDSVRRAVRCQVVSRVQRRGKYILIDLDKGTLLVHLRMTGRLYVRSSGKPHDAHERAFFDLDDGCTLVLNDSRTLGTIRYFSKKKLPAQIQRLGWEPLEETPGPDQVRDIFRRRTLAIKPLLLDQSLWAGIGNIYASEILWDATINPQKRASQLTREEIRRLIDSVPRILRHALECGGTTLRNFADPDGKSGSYQDEFRVYGRDGETCLRCGGVIVRIVQAQRSTYYCKKCQKMRQNICGKEKGEIV